MIAADAYAILGLSPACTLADVRKAYRRKAKTLHPDINKAPGAHEQFIQLREAYEYLLDIKSGKLTIPSPETAAENDTYTWTEQRQEEARERARQYAEMKYREFKKSGHDKYYAFEVGVDFGQFIFSLLVGVTLTIVLSINMGLPGLFVGIFVALIIGFFSYQNLNTHHLGAKGLVKVLASIGKSRTFKAIVLFIVNVIIFFSIGCSTLIGFSNLLFIYACLMALALVTIVVMGKRQGFYLRFYPLCVAPAVVSVFLCLNYFFSSGTKYEGYDFSKEMQYVSSKGGRGYWQQTSTIILQHNVYREYMAIRTFIFYGDVEYKNHIVYEMEDGLFGLRVMKSYKLSVQQDQ